MFSIITGNTVIWHVAVCLPSNAVAVIVHSPIRLKKTSPFSFTDEKFSSED